MNITRRLVSDFESVCPIKLILPSPCQIDDKGDLVKNSRFKSIWDATRSNPFLAASDHLPMIGLIQYPFSFLEKFRNKPLSPHFAQSVQGQKYNAQFASCIEELAALMDAIQQRGPLLQPDLIKLNRISAEFTQLKEAVISSSGILFPQELDAVEGLLASSQKLTEQIVEWATALNHYLDGYEKVDKNLEKLNDQFEKQIRLSDLSTSAIPEFIETLCQTLFLSFGTDFHPELQKDLKRRLANDLEWTCNSIEDWCDEYIDIITKEQGELQHEMTSLLKKGTFTEEEAVYAAGISCQMMLLQTRKAAARKDFLQAAKMLEEALIRNEGSPLWSSFEEQERLLKILKKSAKVMKSPETQIIPLTFKTSISESLENIAPSRIAYLKERIIRSETPPGEKKSALLELKRWYHVLSISPPRGSETEELFQFLKLEEKEDKFYDPFLKDSENLRFILAAERLPTKQSLLGKLLAFAFEPLEMTDETRKLVNFWITGMQLFSAVLQGAKTLYEVPSILEARAEEMGKNFQELTALITPEKMKVIDKQLSIFGNLLSSSTKYDILQQKKQKQEKLGFQTERYPKLEKQLHEILAKYPLRPTEEVRAFLNNNLRKNLVFETEISPFKHLPFSTWYQLFTAPEVAPEKGGPLSKGSSPQEERVVQQTSNDSPQRRIAMDAGISRAAAPSSIFTRLTKPFIEARKSLEKIWGDNFILQKETEPSVIPKIALKNVEQMHARLKEASDIQEKFLKRKAAIQEVLHNFPENHHETAELLRILNSGMAALSRGIEHDLRTVPEHSPSLKKQAQWLQTAEDHCYLIGELEQSLVNLENTLKIPTITPEKFIKTSLAVKMMNYNYAREQQLSNTIAANHGEIARLSQELAELTSESIKYAFSIETATHFDRLKDQHETLKNIHGKQSALLKSEVTYSDRHSIETLKHEALSIEKSLNELSCDIEKFRAKGLISLYEDRQIAELDRFLSEPISTQIDNRLFLHVVGDVYGKNTQLEGGNSIVNLNFLIEFLKKRMISLTDNPLCTDLDKIGFCKALFTGSMIARDFLPALTKDTFENLNQLLTQAKEIGNALEGNGPTGTFFDFYYQATEVLNKLKDPGDSFFFPFKWPKHGLACEIIKEKAGTYAVRFYNTGEGSEKHSKMKVQGVDKQLPFIEMIDIQPEFIQDPLFYKGIWDLTRAGNQDIGQGELEAISLRLKGKISFRKHGSEEYLIPQHSGTCSYRVLIAVLSQLFQNTKNPKHIEWEIELKTINEFYKQHRNNLDDEITLRNLEKGVHEFAILTQDLNNKGIITDAEMRFATSKQEGIKIALKESRKLFEEAERAKRPNVKVTASLTPPAFSSFTDFSPEMPKFIFPNPSIVSLPRTAIAAFTRTSLSSDLQNIINKGLDFTKMDFFGERTNRPPSLPIASNHYQYINAMLLSLPSVTDPIWKEVPEGEITEVIERLNQITGHWIQSMKNMAMVNEDFSMFIPGNVFIGVIKLNTVMDILGQRVKLAGGQKLPNLFQKSFETVLFTDQEKFTLRDPDWEKQMIELKAYWKKRKPKNSINRDFVSFFAVEAMTAEDLNYDLILDKKERAAKHGDVSRRISKNTITGNFVKSFTQFEFLEWAKTYLLQNPNAVATLQREVGFKESDYEMLSAMSLAIKLRLKHKHYYSFSLSKTLPAEFYYFWQMALFTDFTFKGRIDSAEEENLIYQMIDGKPTFFDDVYSIKVGDCGSLFLGDSARRKQIDYYNDWTSRLFEKRNLPPGYLFATQPYPSEAVKDIWIAGLTRRRIPLTKIYGTPLQKLNIDKKTIQELGIEKTRQYLALSSHRNQQVHDTLSYFTENPKELQTAMGRWFFERLFFEPPLLMEALLKHPKMSQIFIGQLSIFLDELYKILNLNDSEFASFLIRVHRLIKDKIDFIRTQKDYDGVKIPPRLLDLQKELSKCLKHCTSQELTEIFHYEQIASYRHAETLRESDIHKLIKSRFAIAFSSKRNDRNQLLAIEAEQAMAKHSAQMADFFEKSALENPSKGMVGSIAKFSYSLYSLIGKTLGAGFFPKEQNDFLNEIATQYFPGFPAQAPLQWELYNHYPTFIAKDPKTNKNYLMDVYQGTLATSEGCLKPLPSQLLERSEIAKLFKSPPLLVESAGNNAWKFSSSDNSTYRMKKENSVFFIQKLINGNWATLTKERFPFSGVDEGKYSWMLDKNGKTSIYFQDKATGIMEARADLDRSATETGLKSFVVYELDSHGKETGLVLDDVGNPDSELHFLTDLEREEDIVFWRKETDGTPIKASLPRLGLSFTFIPEGKGYKILSNEHLGYRIANEQSLPAMKEASHYLILEEDGKINGKKKILIPRKFFTRKEISSLKLKTELKKEENYYGVFSYHVDGPRGELVSSTYEASLFLAMIHLWHHHYRSAAKILQQDQAYRRRLLTLDERRTLESLMRLSDVNGDASPERGLISLYARLILLYNARHFGCEDSFHKTDKFREDTISEYQNYLTQLSRWGDLKFNYEDELFLISEHRSLIIGNDFIKIREAWLQKKTPIVSNPSSEKTNPRMLIGDFGKVAQVILDDKRFLQDLYREAGHEPSLNLVNPRFGSFFPKLYRAVREQNTEFVRKTLHELTGIDYPPMPHKKLIDKLHNALTLIAQLPFEKSNENIAPAFALFLRHILENPHKFSSTEEFEEFLSNKNFKSELFGSGWEWKLKSLSTTKGDYTPLAFFEDKAVPRKIVSVPEKVRDVGLDKPRVVRPADGNLIPKNLGIEEFFAPNANEYVRQIPSQDLSNSKAYLKTAFDLPMKDSIAEEIRKEMLQKITSYAGAAEAENYILTLDGRKGLATLKQSVEKNFQTTEKQLKALQEGIEELINTLPTNRILRSKERLEKVGEQRRLLTIDDAILSYLYRQGSQKMLDKVHAWLLLATNVDKQMAILNAINEIPGKGEIPQEKSNALGRALNAKRAFNPEKHPEYLVLEYFMEILLWEKQVNGLRQLRIHDGKINAPGNLGVALELIMGAGKSAVLLPILSLLFADGKNFALGITLAPLIAEVAEDLGPRIFRAFGQVLEVIKVNRQIEINQENLSMLKQKLEASIEDRHVTLAGDGDMHSLFLKFVETITSTYPKIEEIGEFRQIFRLLKQSGIVSADEIDSIMNVLLSHHYTIGEPQLVTQVSPSYIEGTVAFFKVLMTHSKVKESLGKSSFKEITEQHFKPWIQEIAEEIAKGNVFNSESIVRSFLQQLDLEAKKCVVNYLKGSIQQKDIEFIDKQAPEIQDNMQVIREQLTKVATLTMSKKLRKDYGPPPASVSNPGMSPYISIIYNQGKPIKNSQPGTVLEMINYSLQPYLLEGIPYEIMKIELEGLQKTFAQERFLISDFREASSYKFLKLYFEESQEFDPLDQLSPEKIRKAVLVVKNNPQLIIDIVSRHVLSQIKIFPTQLNSNPELYKFMFKMVFGLTGTLWNFKSLPALFGNVQFSDTAEKTLCLLALKQTPKEVSIIDNSDPQTTKEIISSIYKNQQGSSLIDAAGMLLGRDGMEIAQEMLALLKTRDEGTQGIAFCNEYDRWMILESGFPVPIPLSQTKLKSSSVSVYWDLQHTTGSDVATKPNETAILLFGRSTQLRDLFQAIWRLRKFDKGQSTTFSISSMDEQFIRKTLQDSSGKIIEGAISLKHLLQYALYNQAMKVGDHNYRSLKHRIKGAILEKIWNIMLDQEVSDDEIVRIFRLLSSLFLSTTPERPYTLYGKPTSKTSRSQAMDILHASSLESEAMKAIRSDSFLAKHVDILSLEKELRDLIHTYSPTLPEELETCVDYDLQKEVQVQAQTQKETQTQKEIDVIQDIDDDDLLLRTDHETWEDKGLFSEDYFSDIVRAEELSQAIIYEGRQRHVPLLLFFNLKNPLEFVPKFSKNLSATLNLAPIHLYPDHRALPYSPSQEYPRKMLVVQNIKTHELQTIMLNKDDVQQFNQHLEKDLRTPILGTRDVRMALYDLDTGVLAQGSDPINFKQLEKSKDFLALKVQAKFFSGRLRYTKEEQLILKAWIMEHPPSKIYAFFIGSVLNGRDDTLASFPYTDLYRIFQECGAAVA